MAHEIITLETLALEIARLRGELATWKALAIKQDRLGTAQIQAVNSGATAGKIAQIATNTANITALQQIVSGMFRVVKVAELPATGEPQTMYLVPQTDGTTLNYCNEYLWIDNAWELVGTTGAQANNGELQIIVNGVTVGTFTANQATNSTASITVPTDTSQLTNGAGYVDATALATALASKQDSLSLAQLAAVNSGITSADVTQIGANTTAIAGKQDALTTSQLAAVNSGITSADVTQIGTNTGNIATNSAAIISLQGSKQNTLSAAQLLAVNSGITSSLVTQIGTNQSDITTLNTALGQSLTPSADNTYSLGGASFRYANVYAVTFTGDLTGTASRAIADEDGTSIKTGYVNVAGNQMVTGDKSFTGSNTFNNILPNATNSYSLGSSSYQWSSVYAQSYYYNGTAWGLDKANAWGNIQTVTGNDKGWNIINPDIEKGVIPNANKSSYVWWADKNNNFLGRICSRVHTDGTTILWLSSLNYYKNGALDPTGSSATTSLILGVDANAYKFVQTNADFRPDINNTVNLGTSTNQWKSVYAQSYYYNGTAWGLDKENTWTQNQIIASGTSDKCYFVKDTVYELGQSYSNGEHLGGLTIQDKNGSVVGLLDIVDRAYGNTEMRIRVQQKFDPDSNNRSTSGSVLYNELILGISNAKTNYIGLNADLWGSNHNLGISTNKWKTLNGINPGALSLLNINSLVELDTTGWNLDGTATDIIASGDGWIQVIVNGDSTSYVALQVGYYSYPNCYYRTTGNAIGNSASAMIPVRSGQGVRMYLQGTSIYIARFFPCAGNV